MIVLLIMAFVGIILYEVPGLIRQKHWRELVAFSVFLSFAFLLTLLQTLKVSLPSPVQGIEFLFGDVLGLTYK